MITNDRLSCGRALVDPADVAGHELLGLGLERRQFLFLLGQHLLMPGGRRAVTSRAPTSAAARAASRAGRRRASRGCRRRLRRSGCAACLRSRTAFLIAASDSPMRSAMPASALRGASAALRALSCSCTERSWLTRSVSFETSSRTRTAKAACASRSVCDRSPRGSGTTFNGAVRRLAAGRQPDGVGARRHARPGVGIAGVDPRVLDLAAPLRSADPTPRAGRRRRAPAPAFLKSFGSSLSSLPIGSGAVLLSVRTTRFCAVEDLDLELASFLRP